MPGSWALKVVVGALATGKPVQEDPDPFPRLQRLVRGTVGVETEGAAIGLGGS